MKFSLKNKAIRLSLIAHLVLGAGLWILFQSKRKSLEKELNGVSGILTEVLAPKTENHLQSPRPAVLNEKKSNQNASLAPSVKAQNTQNLPGNSESNEFTTYLEGVRQKILAYQHYPLSARKQRMEGRVEVRITLSAEGRVLDKNVILPGKNTILENAALLAIDTNLRLL